MSTDETTQTEARASVKQRRKLPPEKPVQASDQHLAPGKKLTNERKELLMRAIKAGLRNGLRPSAVLQGCMTQFSLTKNTVQNYLQIARSEMMESSGLWPEQVRDICEASLLEIVQRKAAGNDGAKVRAIQMLVGIFNIKVTPEDTEARQKLVAQEAMEKMDRMSVQELEEFSRTLRSGEKLTPEMLMLTPEEIDKKRPRKKKKKSKYDSDS